MAGACLAAPQQRFVEDHRAPDLLDEGITTRTPHFGGRNYGGELRGPRELRAVQALGGGLRAPGRGKPSQGSTAAAPVCPHRPGRRHEVRSPSPATAPTGRPSPPAPEGRPPTPPGQG